MRTITLVTGNKNKLREYADLLPKGSDIAFDTHELDLPEIQSLDSEEIVRDKLKRAYKILKTPVVVEDVSAGVDNLEGLPGPFFKFFEKKLGTQALLKLGGVGDGVTVSCTAGYYDGDDMVLVVGILRGTLAEPKGENGFGFDPVIIPEGETRTMAEMSPEEKHAISHRGRAARSLLEKL